MNQSDEAFSIHRRAWDLIPWVVNGRASGEERRVVEQHLTECADCREEHAFQSRLHTAMHCEAQPGAQAQADVQAAASLQELWQRIDGARSPVPPLRRRQAGGLARGLLAAVLIEAVGIAALGAALWNREAPPDPGQRYVTLSAAAAAPARATIRAVLAPTLTLGEVQALLGQTRLQIVAGPSEAGVYSLAPLAAGADSAVQPTLAQLRSHPGVRFAEPVDAGARSAP
jgi:hypothetical protein